MQDITKKLLDWYKENKRDLPWRKMSDPYCIWISEIMLQQTRVEAVKPYYERFIKRLPTLRDLACIKEDELLKLWEGLGYYSRVKNMQKAAQILVAKGMQNLPDQENELLALPGIGKYTAGAILSIAFNKPSIAIDGNVYRVLGRYYGITESISKSSTYSIYENLLKKILPKENTGDFTQSFMDLGSLICTTKNPKCDRCPLHQKCVAKKEDNVNKYPVKDKKKEKIVEEITVFIYRYKNKIAIQKRKANGLLASLYEYPNTLNSKTEIDIENELIDQNIPYFGVNEIGESKHIFSHIVWYMKGYEIILKKTIEEYVWVTKEELKAKYSLPTAFSYYTNYILGEKN